MLTFAHALTIAMETLAEGRRRGFAPVEALVAATKQGGELVGWDVGQVKAGYLADLLLVEGDPTADVRILQHKHNLAAIMKGGHFFKPLTRHEKG